MDRSRYMEASEQANQVLKMFIREGQQGDTEEIRWVEDYV